MAKNLPWVMSKFLHLGCHCCFHKQDSITTFVGMKIEEIVAAVTAHPANAVGVESILCKMLKNSNPETLDISILEVKSARVEAGDCLNMSRCLDNIFVPKYVVRKGVLKMLNE